MRTDTIKFLTLEETARLFRELAAHRRDFSTRLPPWVASQ